MCNRSVHEPKHAQTAGRSSSGNSWRANDDGERGKNLYTRLGCKMASPLIKKFRFYLPLCHPVPLRPFEVFEISAILSHSVGGVAADSVSPKVHMDGTRSARGHSLHTWWPQTGCPAKICTFALSLVFKKYFQCYSSIMIIEFCIIFAMTHKVEDHIFKMFD